jgi:hypothetical protein
MGIFFASFKPLKKEVESGSISQRYGSADPDPHQKITDPQHWPKGLRKSKVVVSRV